jgi:hypothetical protein
VGFSQLWGLIAAAAEVTLGGVTNLGHRQLIQPAKESGFLKGFGRRHFLSQDIDARQSILQFDGEPVPMVRQIHIDSS